MVFLIGLCSTVVLYQLIVESVDQRQQAYLDFRAREAAERIENRMATYQQVLRGTAGFFDVHDDVGREDFRRYSDRQALDQYLPGIQGVGFAKAIRPADLQTHIDQVRAEG